jgi:hypothetical protein
MKENMNKFETICETYKHKQLVAKYINFVIGKLINRSESHDNSKIEEPELSVFVEYTPKLANSTYNSEEYNAFLKEMSVALNHHYANNRHHPEHFANGIKDMDLIDLIEMLCDWKASTLRHKDGNILLSIDKNQERFGYSSELSQILKNTVKLFE